MNIYDNLLPLISRLDVNSTNSDAAQRIASEIGIYSHPVSVSFVNAHCVNLMVNNVELFQSISGSKYVFRDGIGVEILMRCLRMPSGENLNGTDLIPSILKCCPPRRVALWGTELAVVGSAAVVVESYGHEVVSMKDGFQPLEFYLNEFEQSNPEIVILGMGMPKQELLSAELCVDSSSSGALVINGGAILDFLGGRFFRAPKLFRKLKLEWLYRLCLEPRRLWQRYLLGNILFLARILKFWAAYWRLRS